jgi:flagellin
MALSVVTNLSSIRAQRNLNKATDSLSGHIEKLSSGLRINRASDDAARSAISAQMAANLTGLKQAERNSNDAISMIQTAEGGMNEVSGIVTRMRELSVQAASSGTMDTTERGYLDQEFQLLESELNRIVEVTEYSGVKLINGDQSAGIDFQVGFSNSANDRISVSISSINGTSLGLDDELLTSATGAAAALTALDTALQSVSTARASLGATQNRLTMTISNLGSMYENTADSLSRLRDVDVAEETAAFTRTKILTDAATSVLASANTIPQSALKLLS